MTWFISHGGTKHGFSYSGIADLGVKLMKAAPDPAARAALTKIFDPKYGDPFEIKPGDAERIGHAMHRAASELRIWDREWARMARQIADSALLAAARNEPWRWS